VTKFVLVMFWDKVDEVKSFSIDEKGLMTLKELNEKLYEVKISCTIM